MEALLTRILAAKTDNLVLNDLIWEHLPFIKTEAAKAVADGLREEDRLCLALLVFMNCVRQYNDFDDYYEIEQRFFAYAANAIHYRLQAELNRQTALQEIADAQNSGIEVFGKFKLPVRFAAHQKPDPEQVENPFLEGPLEAEALGMIAGAEAESLEVTRMFGARKGQNAADAAPAAVAALTAAAEATETAEGTEEGGSTEDGDGPKKTDGLEAAKAAETPAPTTPDAAPLLDLFAGEGAPQGGDESSLTPADTAADSLPKPGANAQPAVANPFVGAATAKDPAAPPEKGSPEYELAAIYSVEQEREALAEELSLFTDHLFEYGIALEDLDKLTPQSEKERLLCVQLAHKLMRDTAMRTSFWQTGTLPLARLAAISGVPYKNIEKHRRYILAIVFILYEDYPGMQAFIPQYEEQANG